MLLNRTIGEDYGMIDAALFQEELMRLDTMGKKRIQVWINSPGGSVLTGYNIYTAILKSNTPVDTYNVGIAASMAGVIFMAGRHRYMADYARLMMHPVQGAEDGKMYSSIMESLSDAICSKSKCTSEEVKSMMTSTTWLTASQCLEKGFCTTIENTNTSNSKYAKKDATALWEVANTLILNSLPIKKQSMKKVTNFLKLNDDASEDAIMEAINSLTSATNAAVAEKEALQTKLTEAEAEVTRIKTELDAANEITDAAKAEVATNNATALITSFKNRIGDKPEAVAKWTELATNDLEGTKAILEALPLNVAAEKIPDQLEPGVIAGGSAQAEMIAIQNRLNKQK